MAENKVQLIVSAVDQTKAVFNDLRNNFQRAIRDTDNFKLKINELSTTFKNVISAVAFYKIAEQLKSAIDVSEQMQNSLRGLGAIARYAGEDIGKSLDAAMKLAEDGLIDVQASAQALQNLLSRGFSLEEATQIIERLKDAAAFNRQASLSMSEAVVSATEGLKNENSILVDNAGITKNVSIMWKEYATEIGKSVEQLTQAEKRQAELNGIMKETEGQVGNAKLAAQGLTGAKAKLSVEILKLKAALGESLTPAFIGIGKAIMWAIDKIKMFLGGIEITGARLGLWWEKIVAILSVKNWFDPKQREALKQRLKELNKAFDEQANEIIQKWEGKIKMPSLGKDTGKRRQDIISPLPQKSSDKLINDWAKVKRDLETDLKKIELDEFDEKIADLEKKAQDLKARFKNIKEASKVIDEWLKGMKAKEIAERDKKQAEEAIKLGQKQADKMAEFQKRLTEAQQTEIQKRIAAEEEWAKEQERLLIAAGVNYEERQQRMVEIHAITAKKIAEIEAEAEKTKQEALIRFERAQLETLIKKGALSKEEGYRREIDLIEKLISQYEALRQKQTAGTEEWLKYGAEIEEMYKRKYELQEKLNEQIGTFEQGYKEGLRRYVDELKTNFQQGVEIARQTAQAMEHAFSDFFFDVFQGKMKSLSDYLRSFLTSVQRALAQALGQQITGGIIKSIGNLFVGSASSATTPATITLEEYNSIGPAGQIWVHTGGYIMHQGGYIPRFHWGGLAHDEVPAILQRGEYVVSRKGVAVLDAINEGRVSLGSDVNVVINMENKTGLPLQLKQRNITIDEKTKTKSILLDLLWTDPEVRNTLAGRV